MNKLYHITFVFLMFSALAYGQHRNEDVFMQLQCEEADGIVYGTYYDFFHKNYMNNTAPYLNGKLVQNGLLTMHLKSEKIYADSIDSTYNARYKVDFLLRHVADRQVDLSYLIDKASLEKALEKWNKDIRKIVLYGGSPDERKIWQGRYNCLRSAIETVNRGNEPSGSRHAFYMDMLSDIEVWHNRLKIFLMGLVSHRDMRKAYEVKDSLPALRRGRIITACQAARVIRLHDYALGVSDKVKK